MVREARTPQERAVSCEVMKGIEVRLLNSKLRLVRPGGEKPGIRRFRLAWDTVGVMVERFAMTSIEGAKEGAVIMEKTGSLNACSTVGSKPGHQVWVGRG